MKSIIKILMVVIAFTTFIHRTNAQTTTPNTINDILKSSQTKIEMLFPEGKSKALILSFDDGRQADRKLVKFMNDYGLKGTFHLNSNRLGTNDYLTKEEIKDLFKGHEVSVHTADHPHLTTLSKIDIIYQVVEDRRELERLTGNTVRGMAYPFGDYNDFVINAITGVGIEYARTVNDSYNFSIPDDFLKWNATIHLFGRAYTKPNDLENDKKELAGFYQLINNFLKADTLSLLDVWGHSYEINDAQTGWDETEKFFKMISDNPAVCYTTQIGLVDYINAYKNLKFSVDKKIVTNLSSMDIFIKKNNQVYKIPAGTTTLLSE